MQKQILRNWIQSFIKGEYETEDRRTQIKAGWFDWFCKDSSLKNKTHKIGSIVKRIKDGGKVDLDKTYIFFKNNCPLNGPLFDDFRICNYTNGNVEFTVQLDCCWNKYKYTVFGRTKDGVFHSEHPLLETNSRKELIVWFNTPFEK